MGRLLTLLGVIALVTSITCAAIDLGLFAIVFYGLALLLMIADSVWLLASRNIRLGLAVLTIVPVLFACSLMPWYGEHGGEPPGKDRHRHMIWKLGHVP